MWLWLKFCHLFPLLFLFMKPFFCKLFHKRPRHTEHKTSPQEARAWAAEEEGSKVLAPTEAGSGRGGLCCHQPTSRQSIEQHMEGTTFLALQAKNLNPFPQITGLILKNWEKGTHHCSKGYLDPDCWPLRVPSWGKSQNTSNMVKCADFILC